MDTKILFPGFVTLFFVLSLMYYMLWVNASKTDKHMYEIILMILIGMMFLYSLYEYNQTNTIYSVQYIFYGYALLSFFHMKNTISANTDEDQKAINYRTLSIVFGYMTILPFIMQELQSYASSTSKAPSSGLSSSIKSGLTSALATVPPTGM
jgi:hypothetical protein